MREFIVDNFLVGLERQIFLNYVQIKRRVQPPDMEKKHESVNRKGCCDNVQP
ncbi:TPA: hypothetical protein ACOEDE_000336 [Enterobacter kobei]|uniref:hypothetical protein n=1 Tax=Enterobacter sp. RIT637 TaxID=2870470 RepID=UPI001C872570|nr:hypothetical protein [Enterobacter sp. RIT637]MBX8462891.1 hypothetical protein [Enterobacter sp. RIT637]